MSSRLNLTGQKFHRLLILSPAENCKSKHTQWNVLCDCGTKKVIRTNSLTRNKIKSCGCYKRENNKHSRKTYGESSFNRLYNNYKQNSKNKNRKFELSKEQFKKLTSSNCHYCARQPRNKINIDKFYGDYIHNGIDRKNNNKDYIISNCIPCCKKCNYLKGTLEYKEFLQLIEEIYKNKIKEEL